MWNFLGGLVGGAANLLGGLFGQSNQDKIAQENIAAQQQYAQNRIQWTVADAQKAGINPLAALGNATQSFSNVAGDNSMAAGISGAGQDISRAVQAYGDSQSKEAELKLQLLRSQIDNVNADTVGKFAEASRLSRTFASPGHPPTFTRSAVGLGLNAAGSGNWPEPMTAHFIGRHGEDVIGLSPEFAKTQFGVGAIPSGGLAAIDTTAGNLVSGANALRGDVGRAVKNLNSPDDWYVPPMFGG